MGDFCPCCNYPHEGDLFPLFCDTVQLAELGEGFPLYFSTAKWLKLLMLVSAVIAGGYCAYKNYHAANVSDESLKSNWIVRGSLADYGRMTPSILEPCLHVAAIAVILLLHNVIAVQHERMEAELDRDAVTPSDYTIIVSDLPTANFDVKDLTEFLSKGSRPVRAM